MHTDGSTDGLIYFCRRWQVYEHAEKTQKIRDFLVLSEWQTLRCLQSSVEYEYDCPISRSKTYSISDGSKAKEINTAEHFVKANDYHRVSLRGQFLIIHQQNMPKYNNTQRKWAIFMYVGKEVRLTTKLLKDSNVKVAFLIKKF
jgi:hypothetical protein